MPGEPTPPPGGPVGVDAPPQEPSPRSSSARSPTEEARVGAQVRSDVGRVASIFGSIRSRWVWGGLILVAATAVLGTVIAATIPLRDWFMHGLLYVVLAVFVLFYLRAHQLRRPIARGVYAVMTVAMLVFFAWVLLDLVAPRPEVREGAILTADGGTGRGPIVAQRPAAGALTLPAVLLGLTAAWLLIHWLVLARRSPPRDHGARG